MKPVRRGRSGRSKGGEKAGSSETKRLFFAVDIPEPTLVSAERILETFDIPPNHVRWVHVRNLHITLKFLGDIEQDRVPALCEAAREAAAGFGPMDLIIEGMGIFPNIHHPRVVWFGVGGESANLAALEAELAKKLEPLGFEPDERPFAPHLTIGRVKSALARGELLRLVHNNQKVRVGPAPVDALHLYESRLSPGGSIYTRIESFPLPGGEKADQ